MTLTVVRAPGLPTTVGFSNVLRSEVTKLRSLRSTWWTLGAATLAAVAVSVIVCLQVRQGLLNGKASVVGLDATSTSLAGLFLTQVAVGALGVLVMSGEYGTGMIRATMTAVPQRRLLFVAKGGVFLGCTFLLGEVLSFAAFAIGQGILAGAGAGASLSDPTVLRATVGGGLYLTAIGLLGFGLGALLRHTAGALSAFFGVLFASTALVDLLPTAWRHHLINYMPLNAGSQILTTTPTNGALSPWTGLGVLSLYGIAAVSAAAVLITRRDV